jgi:hypothetical protein
MVAISCADTNFNQGGSKRAPVVDDDDLKCADIGGEAVPPKELCDVGSAYPTDPFAQKISLKVVAQQDAVLALTHTDLKNSAASGELAGDLIATAKYDGSGNLIIATDWQDIGKSWQGTFASSSEDDAPSITYDIQTFPPEVKNRQCFKSNPVIGEVKPTEKWHWNGWVDPLTNKRYYLTYSAPAAADLDNDGKVEIVSVPSTTNYSGVNGPVVVLNAETGAVLWNTMAAGLTGAAVSTTPALMDLDNDGNVEIVAASFVANTSVQNITVFDYKNKSVRASYSENFICSTYCIPAVADIDGDGAPEIVAGNVILDKQLNRLAYLDPPPATAGGSPTLVDLIPSKPGLEIIVNGSAVYDNLGKLAWSGLCGGFSAASDLDKDGTLELVCIGGGTVYTYASDGTLKWQSAIPVPAPGDPILAGLPAKTGGGGAPNIGDFNGDGNLEIGTAGGYYYNVFSPTGEVVWKTATKDYSSLKTGSTLFDFNGDGKAEVVYGDEDSLKIYDGTTGQVLWSFGLPNNAMWSGTLWEYPLILNIDNDSSVEIVVSSPGVGSAPSNMDAGGIRAFDDPTNLWVGSRKVWNQFSYYPEIVSDQVTAVASPLAPSGFRINSQRIDPNNENMTRVKLPDLGAIPPQSIQNATGANSELLFFVFNRGEATAAAHLKLYDSASNDLIAETKTSTFFKTGIGSVERLTLDRQIDAKTELRLEINVDGSELTTEECDVTNNKITFKAAK